ncbi:hypothetical protein MKX03_021133 [Papaver bracteatum]|nr:hypothetical protein MKX03_021133 [Papaver bracteatum]
MTDQERIRLFRDSLRTPNFTMLIDRKSYSIRDYLPLTAFRSGYMVSYEIGTPRTVTYSFVDTASYLTWLQCKPCKRCYKQGTPIFDPTSSLTCSKLPLNVMIPTIHVHIHTVMRTAVILRAIYQRTP